MSSKRIPAWLATYLGLIYLPRQSYDRRLQNLGSASVNRISWRQSKLASVFLEQPAQGSGTYLNQLSSHQTLLFLLNLGNLEDSVEQPCKRARTFMPHLDPNYAEHITTCCLLLLTATQRSEAPFKQAMRCKPDMRTLANISRLDESNAAESGASTHLSGLLP